MKKVVLSLMLGLGLVAFGASDAKAYCFDFSFFCDCLTVNPVSDSVGGTAVRRLTGTWVNQDCFGTSSEMQGLGADGRNSFAGELNSALGLDGFSWNFTWAAGTGVFDLDSIAFGKVQNESPYQIVAGACPSDCSAALKAPGLPPSRQK